MKPVNEALSRLDGDRQLYYWVLRSFVDNQPNAATLIEEALRLGNMKLASRHAHTIKGLAGTIGAVELEELALKLEDAIHNDEPLEQVMACFECFAAELGRLVTDLKKHLPVVAQTREDRPSGKVNVTVLGPILNKLLEYIVGRDGKVERYLDDYQCELADLPGKDVWQIDKQLKNFDFAAAQETLLTFSTRNGIALTCNDSKD